MNRPFQRRCYTLPRTEIGYLRFLVEGYDGLLFLRTLDARAGLVELAWPPARHAEAEALLAALATEVGLQLAPPPAAGSYLEL